jgi:hypothetical protein
MTGLTCALFRFFMNAEEPKSILTVLVMLDELTLWLFSMRSEIAKAGDFETSPGVTIFIKLLLVLNA